PKLCKIKSAIGLRKQIGDKKGISNSLYNIGIIYQYLSNYKEAVNFLKESLNISKEINALDLVEKNSKSLYEIYKKTVNSKKALELYELYIATRDTLAKQDAMEQLIHLQAKRKYEEQKLTDSLKHEQKILLHQSEAKAQKQIIKRERIIRFGLIGFALLVLFSLGMIFISLKRTKLQKTIIETQHSDLTDSITYARRIQAAVLPSDRIVKQYLKNSFILYLPKDIVAGDFYWMEQSGDKILFAAADCTGHGVPGAMVSVICNNGLNRSVREHKITDPGKILDKTREIIMQEFEKSEDEVRDGMDIALCSLSGNKLQYAGAHNPLWLIRDKELIETKADRQPIGKFSKIQPFTT
ncbi:MAG TPA: hypothetical protein EYN89_13140, partial [Flavobacteriales bacterium]|nr:hypothetical protein [Flavobacteriales bacterium]